MGVDSKIHIAIAFDRNFITPFYVLLTSIFSHNKKADIFFHTIAEDLTEKEKNDIEIFVRRNNSNISFYSIDKHIVQQFALPEAGHISAATYYRLYFSELISGSIEKLLYLDTDIVVIGDLAKLYGSYIDEFVVGAVPDPQINSRPELGIAEGNYFNAGVLLINLKEWRNQKVSEKAIEFLRNNPKKALWGDQDALNYVLIRAWYKLDKAYNVTFYDVPKYLRKKDFNAYLQDKIIIHYTTQNKPWLATCSNRLRYLYHCYLDNSPHASYGKYLNGKLRSQDRYKLIKRQLKELLIDMGVRI